MKLHPFLILLVALLAVPGLKPAESRAGLGSLPAKLYVANTGGDSLSVIDVEERKVVREIRVGSHPHGLAASLDGRRLYCTVESDQSLKFIDPIDDRIIASVPLTGRPNQLAATPDGKWVYVAINDRGTADVVDVMR